jgi:type III secretory pathway component EscS
VTLLEWLLIILAVAVVLLASGFVGLIILFFRALERHDDREND